LNVEGSFIQSKQILLKCPDKFIPNTVIIRLNTE
jgi:hypothetical protein